MGRRSIDPLKAADYGSASANGPRTRGHAPPGAATAGILAFANLWDEFLLALSFNSASAYRTLPVGITLYQGDFSFPWPEISAALVLGIVPVTALIILFQQCILAGLTAGGLKG